MGLCRCTNWVSVFVRHGHNTVYCTPFRVDRDDAEPTLGNRSSRIERLVCICAHARDLDKLSHRNAPDPLTDMTVPTGCTPSMT